MELNSMQQQDLLAHTTASPTEASPTVTKTRKSVLSKWIIITIVAIVILGSGGAGIALALHLFDPPQPIMDLTSAYTLQGKPVGANGTIFHIRGQKFATNSAITFLLDNKPIKTQQQVQSDGNGEIATDLTVTSSWSIGRHMVKARDANNDVTNIGTVVNIVQPGQAHTPGPNRAPADDTSFTIQLNVQALQDADNTATNYTYTLIVTGHPDPQGGSVCSPGDNGQPSSDTYTDNNDVTYNRTFTYSCTGTYKGGVISYSETLKTEMVTSSDGDSCQLNAPQPNLQITGSYTNQHTFSGKATLVTTPESAYTCTQAGGTYQESGNKGTWAGTVSIS
jgi:hypothetical protein